MRCVDYTCGAVFTQKGSKLRRRYLQKYRNESDLPAVAPRFSILHSQLIYDAHSHNAAGITTERKKIWAQSILI
jgi:hypothetical protein